MRSYDVAAASLAIDAPHKWTDNLLSQYEIEDVLSARRGVARRILRPALLRIALIRVLHTSLGISVGSAVSLSAELLASATGEVEMGGLLTLRLNRSALERQLNTKLHEVLESAPSRRRGRPPQRH